MELDYGVIFAANGQFWCEICLRGLAIASLADDRLLEVICEGESNSLTCSSHVLDLNLAVSIIRESAFQEYHMIIRGF